MDKAEKRIPLPHKVSCCYNCPVKWVSEEYNCHSHCEVYADQCWDDECARRKKLTESILEAQRVDMATKARKKRRTVDFHRI